MMGISFNGKSQLSVNEPGTKICGCDVFSTRKHKNINPVRGDFQPLIADTRKSAYAAVTGIDCRADKEQA